MQGGKKKHNPTPKEHKHTLVMPSTVKRETHYETFLFSWTERTSSKLWVKKPLKDRNGGCNNQTSPQLEKNGEKYCWTLSFHTRLHCHMIPLSFVGKWELWHPKPSALRRPKRTGEVRNPNDERLTHLGLAAWRHVGGVNEKRSGLVESDRRTIFF